MPESWDSLPWNSMQRTLRQIQMKMVEAEENADSAEVARLQRKILASREARLLAVRHVSSNSGKRTPGVDGHVWDTPGQKLEAARTLSPDDYQPRPARRVLIPKGSGCSRPLSILTMKDRAMQALYLFTLDPLAETHADPHSYGYRKFRSAADAIERCREIFEAEDAPAWALEADIAQCFDSVSHDWLLSHIPLERKLLRAWITAGYMEEGKRFPAERGLPQGGIISPVLMNMALDGLEAQLSECARAGRRAEQVFFTRYADDFVVICRSKRVLQRRIRPCIEAFLAERGLRLSEEKTRLSPLRRGIDFLGVHFRQSRQGLKISPAPGNVERFLQKIDQILLADASGDPDRIARSLSRMLRGWSEYYKHLDALPERLRIDRHVGNALWKWSLAQERGVLKRRKVRRRFSRGSGGIRTFLDSAGIPVFATRDVARCPHTPIEADCNAYALGWQDYLRRRRHSQSQASAGATKL